VKKNSTKSKLNILRRLKQALGMIEKLVISGVYWR
jgi:hypothetical protein